MADNAYPAIDGPLYHSAQTWSHACLCDQPQTTLRLQSREEAGQIIRHRWHQEAAVKEKVSHLAARFGDQQAAMARGAMGCSVAAPIVWFMIGTNWVI